MKFKKISTRMLTFVLPVLIIPMLILTLVSIASSQKAIGEQLDNRMYAELSAAERNVEEQLKGISTAATIISDMVAGNYTHTSAREYQNILTRIIQSDDMILGSGLWFEPYTFDAALEYFGPYIYKDGGQITVTYEYSNAEYNYFIQEYYLNAKNSTSAVITDPYYDPTSGLIMSTCSAPILSDDGRYIGCVTVDIELSSITDLVNNISVGKTGKAIMLDSVGTYLAGVDDSKIANALKITEDSDKEMAGVGAAVMGRTTGTENMSSGRGAETVYYTTVPSTGWKLMIHITDSEIYSSINRLMLIMALVSVIAVIVEILLISLVIRDISKKTIYVKNFVGELSQGNFTVDRLNVTSEDEIGVMSGALNEMYDNNKGIISGIAGYAI